MIELQTRTGIFDGKRKPYGIIQGHTKGRLYELIIGLTDRPYLTINGKYVENPPLTPTYRKLSRLGEQYSDRIIKFVAMVPGAPESTIEFYKLRDLIS